MAITINSPKNSFVKFNFIETTNSCCDGNEIFCLPVCANDDIRFQFSINTDSISQADDVMASPIEDVQLILQTTTGIEINNWTTEDGLLFERYRTGAKQITYVWKNELSRLVPIAIDRPPYISLLNCDDCFLLKIRAAFTIAGDLVERFASSNCFKIKCDPCYTSVLEFSNEEDFAGYLYCNTGEAANRVRLPFYFSAPQFTDDETIYVRSDGSAKLLKSVSKKEYEAQTEYFPEYIHEALKIALSHDTTRLIEGSYVGFFRKSGNYEIEWTDNECTAPAKFKALVTPYNIRNNNCGGCNQSFNCASIDNLTSQVIYNYGTSMQDFIFTFDPIAPAVAPNILLQYRLGGTTLFTTVSKVNVQPIIQSLPIGIYEFRLAAEGINCVPEYTPIVTLGSDEAPFCQVPTIISIEPESTVALIQFAKVIPTPAGGYEYDIIDDSGDVVTTVEFIVDATGSNVLLTANFLTPNTNYTFRLRSNCGAGNVSIYATQNFTTTP